jgi:hypothetical protein
MAKPGRPSSSTPRRRAPPKAAAPEAAPEAQGDVPSAVASVGATSDPARVALDPPPPVDEEPTVAPAEPPLVHPTGSELAAAVVEHAVRPPPRGKPLRGGWLALDRAAVLLIGVAVGAAIGAAFVGAGGGGPRPPAKPSPPAAAQAPAKATVGLDCPTPFPPHLLQALASNQPINVGVFGDSFGDGVWAALYHLLPKNYHVLRFSKESTGFTRYASNNLEDTERQQLSGQPVDVAVIDFGANDTQGIYDGGHAWPLLSDGWKNVYGARMDRFVQALRDQGAMVYWVGLPIMRKPEYDSQISNMLAFYDQRMTAMGVPFIDVRALSEDENGQFNDYLRAPGSVDPKLMRANDGIHMSMAGYERIAAPAAQRIQDYVNRAKAYLAIISPPAAAAPTSAAASPTQAPSQDAPSRSS